MAKKGETQAKPKLVIPPVVAGQPYEGYMVAGSRGNRTITYGVVPDADAPPSMGQLGTLGSVLAKAHKAGFSPADLGLKEWPKDSAGKTTFWLTQEKRTNFPAVFAKAGLTRGPMSHLIHQLKIIVGDTDPAEVSTASSGSISLL